MINNFYNWIKTFCNLLAKPAKDKILHFALGYIVFDYFFSICVALELILWLNILLSVLMVTIVIFGKEVVDEKNYNGFDLFDLLASYLGVLLKAGALTILVV